MLEPVNFRPWLAEHGWLESLHLTPLQGGGNNRLLLCDDGTRKAVLKHYFSPERRAREVSFCRVLEGRARLPKVLAEHPTEAAVLLEFLPGSPPRGPVRTEWVDGAAHFIIQLNAAPRPSLRLAVEGGTCQSQHLHLASARLDRLAAAGVAGALVADLRSELARVAARLDLNEKPLKPDALCLSPSDFGFHNCLIDSQGGLNFVDFEFAGSDDPAKLVCDFACQPRLPVTAQQAQRFCECLQQSGLFAQDLGFRARQLLAVFVIRWCCILLNPLLAQGETRRKFLGHDAPPDPATIQARAREYLQLRLSSWD